MELQTPKTFRRGWGLRLVLAGLLFVAASQVGPAWGHEKTPPSKRDPHKKESLGTDPAWAWTELTDRARAESPQVNRWIHRYSTSQRKHFATWLTAWSEAVPFLEPIIQQYGLPGDLVCLAMIESGLNSHARSRAEAVGLWQFTAPTARRYLLRVGGRRDERLDVVKSTHAAARYLSDLYDEFGDWRLAAAAFNAGPGRVRQALSRHRVGNIWDYFHQGRLGGALPSETRNFVPKLLAAAIIARSPGRFGFEEAVRAGTGDFDDAGELLENLPVITDADEDEIAAGGEAATGAMARNRIGEGRAAASEETSLSEPTPEDSFWSLLFNQHKSLMHHLVNSTPWPLEHKRSNWLAEASLVAFMPAAGLMFGIAIPFSERRRTRPAARLIRGVFLAVGSTIKRWWITRPRLLLREYIFRAWLRLA